MVRQIQTRFKFETIVRESSVRNPFLLFVTLFVLFSANARKIGNGDTQGTMLVPVAILRGDGPFLDRWERDIESKTQTLPYSYRKSHGHVVSRYPITTSILVTPIFCPQVWILDLANPGWDHSPVKDFRYFDMMDKITSAMIAALTGVLLYLLLRKQGLGRVAGPTILLGSLGSSLWSIAGQSLWQHGPAALALSLVLLLLCDDSSSRIKLGLAGLFTGLLVAIRLLDVVLAIPIAIWVTKHHGRNIRSLVQFFVPLVLVLILLFTWNLYIFGSFAGGQAELETLHPQMHALTGAWDGRFLDGLGGTLISPSHGLFVFTPWIIVALCTLPFTWNRIRAHSLILWLTYAMIPYLLIMSKYSVWWAGQCFGPRYWTEFVPVFIIILGYGIDYAWDRSRLTLAAFIITLVVSVFVHFIGTFYYPSSWHQSPNAAEYHHERFWDWHDSEITRCLREGMQMPRPFVVLRNRFRKER